MKGFQSLFLSIRRRLSNRSTRVFPKPVKRIVQATLIAVGAVTSLLGLGLLAINLYVQSPGTQVRLREIVSENLGYPVSVFRISFTPWSGFHLQDVSIQDPSVHYPILKAQDLWIQCNYLPLLRRKLIVRQVFLSEAEIRAGSTRKSYASGKWCSGEFMGRDPQVQNQPRNDLFLRNHRRADRDTARR